MTLFPIFALMLAPNPPLPLSDAQMRDIGCVAAIGIIAHEQRSGQGASQSYPEMRESGKRWAGIVGDRVMEESGQPREVVAFAIKQAVEAEQEQAMKSADPAAYVQARIGQCRPIMDAQLGAADAVNELATDGPPLRIFIDKTDLQTMPDKSATLILEGQITNLAETRVAVPLIVLKLTNEQKHQVYSTTFQSDSESIEPLQSTKFTKAFSQIPNSDKVTSFTLTWAEDQSGRANGTYSLPTDNSPSILATEPDWNTDDPEKIGLYRTQLGEDMSNPHRIRYCKAMIDMSAKEIAGREGADSRDAQAFARLAAAFAFKANSLPKAEKPMPISAEELQAELQKEPSKEEKMARCLRLGDSLALAMPPEE